MSEEEYAEYLQLSEEIELYSRVNPHIDSYGVRAPDHEESVWMKDN